MGCVVPNYLHIIDIYSLGNVLINPNIYKPKQKVIVRNPVNNREEISTTL